MNCCALTSGMLRNRLQIERATQVPNGSGGYTNTWESITGTSMIRAYIKPLSGNERYQAARIESDVTHKVYMRYRTDFGAADRINYNGRIMQIKAVLNIEERNKWLELNVVEGPAT